MVFRPHLLPGTVHTPAHTVHLLRRISARKPTHLPRLLRQVFRRSVMYTVFPRSRPRHQLNKRIAASAAGYWRPWVAACAGHRRHLSRRGGRRQVRLLGERLLTRHLRCVRRRRLVVDAVDGIECPWRSITIHLPTRAHNHDHVQGRGHGLPHCVDLGSQVGTCRRVSGRRCLRFWRGTSTST